MRTIRALKETLALFILLLQIAKLILVFTLPNNLYFMYFDFLTAVPLVLQPLLKPKIIHYCTKFNKNLCMYLFLFLNYLFTIITDIKIGYSNNSINYSSVISLYYVLKELVLCGVIMGICGFIKYKNTHDELVITRIIDTRPSNEEISVINLKSIAFSDIGEINTHCSICLEEYDENTPLYQLINCDHVFHADCIIRWIETNETCPLCRTDVMV